MTILALTIIIVAAGVVLAVAVLRHDAPTSEAVSEETRAHLFDDDEPPILW